MSFLPLAAASSTRWRITAVSRTCALLSWASCAGEGSIANCQATKAASATNASTQRTRRSSEGRAAGTAGREAVALFAGLGAAVLAVRRAIAGASV
ncbi:MAG: hypothetical protein QM765_05115 [Myxococcales bacterium]